MHITPISFFDMGGIMTIENNHWESQKRVVDLLALSPEFPGSLDIEGVSKVVALQ